MPDKQDDLARISIDAPNVTEARKYVFRGDESYRGGPVGRELGDEADAADIQDFADHVLRKESTRSSRFTSFTRELKIARLIFTSGTDNCLVIKVEFSRLQELKSRGVLRIWEADQVFDSLSHGPGKLAKRAKDVRTAMQRNRELLIEGQIPAESLYPVYS